MMVSIFLKIMKSLVVIDEVSGKISELFINFDIEFETQFFSPNRDKFIFPNINIMLDAIELLDEQNVKYYILL
jgi:hypothetical protein